VSSSGAASPGAAGRCAPTAQGLSPAPDPQGADPADEARNADDFPLPSPETLFGLICVVGGLFALIGLMPDFDGWGEQDGRHKHD